MSDAGPMSGRTALVTGAGRGIGRAIALRLAQSGADLAICARTAKELEATAEAVGALGRRVVTAVGDVSREADVERFVGAARSAFGHVDVLVNNAAVFLRRTVVETSPAEWDRVLSVNLRGAFLVTRAVVPHMLRRRSGTVVFIASTAGKRADPGLSAYCASKFALHALAQSLLYEVRDRDVRVVVVTPSLVDTSDPPKKGAKDRGPGVLLRMEDVADAVHWAVTLPGRALIRDVELWGTNPAGA